LVNYFSHCRGLYILAGAHGTADDKSAHCTGTQTEANKLALLVQKYKY